eukprot:CAMPEP_0194341010 /NCGR_PEP_ID=MMETSP0171-20130528/88272_1 /TAXON_ID=218684 /ORGANISM="Corethron pennatum, Strain L29A3" /LENGTH=42 /DNA_ID= /DNA_START= /DNA_END= /DNA_ORIENTATION=
MPRDISPHRDPPGFVVALVRTRLDVVVGPIAGAGRPTSPKQP